MDNRFIIDNLLMQSESDQLEFKAHLDENNIAKHITAMLNGRGGTILVGVNEEKSTISPKPPKQSKTKSNGITYPISPSTSLDVNLYIEPFDLR